MKQMLTQSQAGLNVAVEVAESGDLRCACPKNKDAGAQWNSASGVLDVRLPQEFSARIFEIGAP